MALGGKDRLVLNMRPISIEREMSDIAGSLDDNESSERRSNGH
jgi:hypothetical protein